jgi:erythromycin esterase-like protein
MNIAPAQTPVFPIQEAALPLQTPKDLYPLIERIGDARIVLLGEASHGTSEYYRWRTVISQWLIQEKGFSFIAVEGDWPDCYRVNQYVKGYADGGKHARDVLHAFSRWPTWMWANWEVVALVEGLTNYNRTQPPAKKVGFYGLDVYSLWESLEAVTHYLEESDGDALAAAREAYRCFQPYHQDVQAYARATHMVPVSCEDEVVDLLTRLQSQSSNALLNDDERAFNAEQNALVARGAERYYRTMIKAGPDSWNIRDNHMVETLERLLQHHGPDAKAIVWEHNTHIGDARATDMAGAGMVNVGQLVREGRAANEVVAVGFGSHRGTVIAAQAWDAPMEVMQVPPARDDSWEDLLHQAVGGDHMLILTDGHQPNEIFRRPRGHRAIGVVYDPAFEYLGNYVPTSLSRRYDAFIYLDETTALHPLHMEPEFTAEPPETYPWNV